MYITHAYNCETRSQIPGSAAGRISSAVRNKVYLFRHNLSGKYDRFSPPRVIRSCVLAAQQSSDLRFALRAVYTNVYVKSTAASQKYFTVMNVNNA